MAVVQFALEMENAIEDIANAQEDLVALIVLVFIEVEKSVYVNPSFSTKPATERYHS